MAEVIAFKVRPALWKRIKTELKGRKPCEKCGADWCVHFNPEAYKK